LQSVALSPQIPGDTLAGYLFEQAFDKLSLKRVEGNTLLGVFMGYFESLLIFRHSSRYVISIV